MAGSMDTSCDIYTCAVCLENMIDKSPRLLSCHHTFCLRCLQTLPINGSKLECPTCRQETFVDNEDVSKLTANFMLIQMQDHMQKLLKNKDAICHLCKALTAQQKCKDCTHLLCGPCIEKHNALRQFEDHKLVPVCPKHPEGIISHICLECVEAVCTLCILIDHAEHENSLKSYEIGMTSLKSNIDDLTRKVQQRLKLAKTRQENNKKNIAQTDAIKAEVKKIVVEYTKQVDEANEILSDIYEHDKNRQTILEDCDTQIKEHQALLTSLSKYETMNDALEGYKKLRKESQQIFYRGVLEIADYPPFKTTSPLLLSMSENRENVSRLEEAERENKTLKTMVSDIQESVNTLENQYRVKCKENKDLQAEIRMLQMQTDW